MVSIKEFSIDKKGEYKASITGSCPFWLDPSLKNKMLDKDIVHIEPACPWVSHLA